MQCVFLVATLAFFLVLIAQSNATKQTCECSSAEMKVDQAFSDYHALTRRRRRRNRRRRQKRSTDEAPDPGTRIVGGYNALKPRPWVAKIQVGPALCGGSVINKRYVLTAAHCVCSSQAGSNIFCSPGGIINYDPKEVFKVYLGLNSKKVSIDMVELRGSPNEYGVEAVKSHEKYNYLTYDIALLKLDRDIEFKKDFIMPICLPVADDTADIPTEKGQVLSLFVAGWGRTQEDCTTNEFGPVRSQKCSFPFDFKDNHYTSCSGLETPSKEHKECKSIRRGVLKSKYLKDKGEHLIIDTGSKNISCYPFESGSYGWCKSFKDTDILEDNNWGWCKAGCAMASLDSSDRLSTNLQETQLEVLPLPHCKHLVNSANLIDYKFIGKLELCAGKKKKFKETEIYKKENDEFKLQGTVPNYFGLNDDGKYPYEYFISGTDSCGGDSGGPAYMWVDGKPILYGVVSRGMGSDGKSGCAELNFPGIYTRTNKFLDWINENSADGNC